MEPDETFYEIAEASAVGTAHLDRNDQASISFRKVLHSLKTACRLCRERYRQRRQLLEMDDRELKDIGISREQAEQEGRKPLWKGYSFLFHLRPKHRSSVTEVLSNL
jgi:uncharacterized protein YjiS (DUF1127 family)